MIPRYSFAKKESHVSPEEKYQRGRGNGDPIQINTWTEKILMPYSLAWNRTHGATTWQSLPPALFSISQRAGEELRWMRAELDIEPVRKSKFPFV